MQTFPGFDQFSPADWAGLAAAGQGHATPRGLRLDGGDAPKRRIVMIDC